MSDEVPEWLGELIEQVTPHLSWLSVGQLDLRWAEEDEAAEVLIAPAVFTVESDDEQDGDTGFSAFLVEEVAGVAAVLKDADGNPGSISCGPTEDSDVTVLAVEGRFGTRDVWLQIQFEPFEDAEPSFVLDLRDEGDQDPAGEAGNGEPG